MIASSLELCEQAEPSHCAQVTYSYAVVRTRTPWLTHSGPGESHVTDPSSQSPEALFSVIQCPVERAWWWSFSPPLTKTTPPPTNTPRGKAEVTIPANVR